MTKIGTFDAYRGRVGGLYVVTSNILQRMDSFLFNIINIMKLISRLVIPYYARRQIES